MLVLYLVDYLGGFVCCCCGVGDWCVSWCVGLFCGIVVGGCVGVVDGLGWYVVVGVYGVD